MRLIRCFVQSAGNRCPSLPSSRRAPSSTRSRIICSTALRCLHCPPRPRVRPRHSFGWPKISIKTAFHSFIGYASVVCRFLPRLSFADVLHSSSPGVDLLSYPSENHKMTLMGEFLGQPPKSNFLCILQLDVTSLALNLHNPRGKCCTY